MRTTEYLVQVAAVIVFVKIWHDYMRIWVIYSWKFLWKNEGPTSHNADKEIHILIWRDVAAFCFHKARKHHIESNKSLYLISV